MSFRETSVTDEKIAIDFVASAHDAGCHEGYQQVTFSSNLDRVSVPIEGCLRKIGGVRRLRTGRKSK